MINLEIKTKFVIKTQKIEYEICFTMCEFQQKYKTYQIYDIEIFDVTKSWTWEIMYIEPCIYARIMYSTTS